MSLRVPKALARARFSANYLEVLFMCCDLTDAHHDIEYQI